MAALTVRPHVQYVVVRGDLLQTLKWPTGAVIAQACHACTAALHLFRNDENVIQYTADLDNMHKVVLEAKNEETLRKLSAELTSSEIDHKLWIEQPENYATCLAVKPYPKEQIQKYFKKLKLYK
ncbi:putative peptidyl-tRNA hydrolase PTRHD1 [Asterias rubens]|uniref:putative peptidyl-tRNA hydrolase PTRHD1 n=1 Tax=Asterias rubens TaxID=7604 RepID=UPI0014550164|nr:putative peptidyl-tRNA hydrolase PTRHD1 [Asterias rubens]XP_033646518.1 putative peptidyl-tRNA hydrolase PTRHD1 [Asterias rubens]